MIESQPTLAIIVAMAENRVIGKDNQLPWHLPADLKHFKMLTTHHPIIMGKKTYLSIGKPLPNRINIILTRDPHFTAEGCFIAHSIDSAIKIAKEQLSTDTIFFIGGDSLYQQLLTPNQIDVIYQTIVHAQIEGDAYFPEINKNDWQKISCETHTADEKNAYNYSFIKWALRQK